MKEKYSGTSIFRRCGQLSIPYDLVINSPYFRNRNKRDGYCRIAYDEGTKGTIDWGKEKRPIVVGQDVPAFDKNEMMEFLQDEQEESIEETVSQDMDSMRSEETFEEGGKSLRFVNFHERNPKLRSRAIELQGTICKVCGFDFYKTYGPLGKLFIEVHHNKPVSTLKEKTQIDPEVDMDVLCSNCHRMIHRKKNNVLTVEQLKRVMNTRANSQ